MTRQTATTCIEVAGLVGIAAAVALTVGSLALGVGLVGAILLLVGFVEGRR